MKNLNSKTKYGGLIYTVVLLFYTVLSYSVSLVFKALNVQTDVYYAIYPVFSAGTLLACALFCRKKFSIEIGFNKFSAVNLIYVLMISAGVLFGFGFLSDLVSRAIESLGGVISRSDVRIDAWWKYIVYSLSLCVLPAIAEESFFRGTLLRSFPKENVVSAIFTTAFCFALYHLNAAQFIYQFIYGAILGVLTISAKSIIPAIITHFINNFAVITLDFFSVAVDFYNIIFISCWACCVAVVIAVMWSGIAVKLFAEKKTRGKEKTSAAKEFYIPFGIVGIIFSLLVIILSVTA